MSVARLLLPLSETGAEIDFHMQPAAIQARGPDASIRELVAAAGALSSGALALSSLPVGGRVWATAAAAAWALANAAHLGGLLIGAFLGLVFGLFARFSEVSRLRLPVRLDHRQYVP